MYVALGGFFLYAVGFVTTFLVLYRLWETWHNELEARNAAGIASLVWFISVPALLIAFVINKLIAKLNHKKENK